MENTHSAYKPPCELERPIGAFLATEARAWIESAFERPLAATCEQAATQGKSPLATEFGRYAANVLADAGAGELASVARRRGLKIVRLDATGLARICASVPLPDNANDLIAPFEGAFNRLVLIADALAETVERLAARRPTRPSAVAHWAISRMGVGLVADDDSTAPTSRMLHESQLPEHHHAGLMNEMDWLVIDSIANKALRVFQGSLCPNEYQTPLGAFASKGGEWDVRTRMANDLEHLRLPFALRYTFDCDVRKQTCAIAFAAPDARCFPMAPATGNRSPGAGCALQTTAACSVYSLRLSGLLAAVCFGAGARIDHAFVTIYDREFEHAIASMRFDRQAYVFSTLQHIQSGTYSAARHRFDPRGFLDVLDAQDIAVDIDEDGAFRPVAPLDVGMRQQRIPTEDDDRILPERLRKLFHARCARDIDTLHYLGDESSAETIEQAKRDADESPLAAIAALEELAGELRWDAATAGEATRPLFCDHPVSRAMVSLLDEQGSVGQEAEEYLATGRLTRGDANGLNDVLYMRCPSALFHAYVGLSDLYQRVGDARRAYAMADRCIALGPTTAIGYLRKADTLAEMGRFVEAANVISSALEFAVLERDWTLLYYNLALMMWNMGERACAIALYAYLSHGTGDIAGKSRTILEDVKRSSEPRYVPASRLEAARIMKRARIPLVPTETAKHLVARAAVELSNAGMPLAAAPYAELVADFSKGDVVLTATYASLRHGTDAAKPAQQDREGGTQRHGR